MDGAALNSFVVFEADNMRIIVSCLQNSPHSCNVLKYDACEHEEKLERSMKHHICTNHDKNSLSCGEKTQHINVFIK